MPVLDASVAVSFCIPEDVNHDKAVVFFESFSESSDSLIAPELIRLELMAALKRRGVEFGDIEAALKWLDVTLFSMQTCDGLFESSQNVILKTGVRAGDAFYVACARDNETVLITFDKDQAARAKILSIEVTLL